MIEKIVSGVVWLIWLATIVWCVTLALENKVLRAALNEPVNCEAVCEVMFEELGC